MVTLALPLPTPLRFRPATERPFLAQQDGQARCAAQTLGYASVPMTPSGANEIPSSVEIPESKAAAQPIPLHPGSADDLTRRNVALVAEIERAEEAHRTPVDRAVDSITAFCGSMAFVWVHLLWFGGWMIANLLPKSPLRFDPFPFQLLTLVVSLEAIFLSTFVLISQNRQARLADRRNHLDLQINLLSEQENTKMLSLLEQIARRVDVNVARDEELRVMKEATSTERLVDQIREGIEQVDGTVENAAGDDTNR